MYCNKDKFTCANNSQEIGLQEPGVTTKLLVEQGDLDSDARLVRGMKSSDQIEKLPMPPPPQQELDPEIILSDDSDVEVAM